MKAIDQRIYLHSSRFSVQNNTNKQNKIKTKQTNKQACESPIREYISISRMSVCLLVMDIGQAGRIGWISKIHRFSTLSSIGRVCIASPFLSRPKWNLVLNTNSTFDIYWKMLENRPNDALGNLVKFVNLLNLVKLTKLLVLLINKSWNISYFYFEFFDWDCRDC